MILGKSTNTYWYGKFAWSGEFPIPINLLPQEKEKCKKTKPNTDPKIAKMQEQLKKGNFVIKKERTTDAKLGSVVKITAHLKLDPSKHPLKEYMAHLEAATKGTLGECDHVTTLEDYRGCSLAVYLMATCFQDEWVIGKDRRGYSIENDVKWNDDSENKAKAQAHCETITYLRCAPNNNPIGKGICITYLRAGKMAHFDLIFMRKPGKKMNVFKIGDDLEKEFKGADGKNGDNFVKQHGSVWYFCKCKNPKSKECSP